MFRARNIIFDVRQRSMEIGEGRLRGTLFHIIPNSFANDVKGTIFLNIYHHVIVIA
jgi:hypothetical protein